MTFTEAAARVLRLVGKPLHYKEITDVAIEKNFLSHVGKSPEVTMGARLAALVKKGEKDNPLVRIKPGVFALREWDQETIDKGLADRTPALERIAADDTSEEVAIPEAPAPSPPSVETEDEELGEPDEEERQRAEFAEGGKEIFGTEDDDDELIFGSDDEEQEAEAAKTTDDGEGRGRRRRRRRRKGRGEDRDDTSDDEDDLPSYTMSDAPADTAGLLAETDEGASESETTESTDDDSNGADAVASGEDTSRRRTRGRRGRDRDRDRDWDRDRDRDRDRGRGRGRYDGAPLDELAGRSLGEAVHALLSGYDKNRGPVSFQSLADSASRNGHLNLDSQLGQSLVLAAVRSDNLRAEQSGERPRFRIAGNKVALSEWSLDGELSKFERDLAQMANKYREGVRRALLRQLQQLPQRAFGELITLVLERAGVAELAPVRRSGSHGAELHLSGKLTEPVPMRLGIVVRRDGREIGREHVTELRGALHHYGPADAGYLLTPGQVLSGAREEAAAPGAAPVTLVDGNTLARMCEDYGLGVSQQQLRVPILDVDLFDALRAG